MQSIQSHKEKIYDPKKKPHSSHKVEAVRNSAAATQLYNVPDDQREHVVDEVQKLISITRYPPCRTCLRSGDDEGATIKGSRHKSMKNPILIGSKEFVLETHFQNGQQLSVAYHKVQS